MAISADNVEKGKALAASLKIPFPLLADPELHTIRAFGVREQDRRIAVPATFLIRRDGQVAWRHVGGTISSRASVDVLLREIAKIRDQP